MNREIDGLLIHPTKLCHEQARVEKSINIKDLDRLHAYIGSTEGEIQLAFEIKAIPYDGRLVLSLQLNGSLNILCQRCNETYDWPLSISTNIMIEDGIAQSIQIDKDYEAVITDERGELDMLSVITDEMVLGLPFAHEGECQNTHYRKYVYNAAKAHSNKSQSGNLGEF